MLALMVMVLVPSLSRAPDLHLNIRQLATASNIIIIILVYIIRIHYDFIYFLCFWTEHNSHAERRVPRKSQSWRPKCTCSRHSATRLSGRSAGRRTRQHLVRHLSPIFRLFWSNSNKVSRRDWLSLFGLTEKKWSYIVVNSLETDWIFGLVQRNFDTKLAFSVDIESFKYHQNFSSFAAEVYLFQETLGSPLCTPRFCCQNLIGDSSVQKNYKIALGSSSVGFGWADKRFRLG